MDTAAQKLYILLSACAGNWHNAVFIAGSEKDGPGYLLSADRDGRPIVMSVEQFRQLTGEAIDPAECCGRLTEDAFKALYAQYLLWRMPKADSNPFDILSQDPFTPLL